MSDINTIYTLLTIIFTIITIIATLTGMFFAFARFLIKPIEVKLQEFKDETKDSFKNIDASFNRLNTRVDQLNIRVEQLDTRVEQTNIRVEQLNTRVEQLNIRVDDLYKIISTGGIKLQHVNYFAPDSKNINLPPAIATGGANSPSTLNARGVSVAEKIKAHELVEKYASKILIPEDTDELNIQNTCFDFAFNGLLKIVNQEELKVIREAIYEEGGRDADVIYVYGILFRDYYLKEKGYSVPEYI